MSSGDWRCIGFVYPIYYLKYVILMKLLLRKHLLQLPVRRHSSSSNRSRCFDPEETNLWITTTTARPPNPRYRYRRREALTTAFIINMFPVCYFQLVPVCISPSRYLRVALCGIPLASFDQLADVKAGSKQSVDNQRQTARWR